MTTAYQIFDSLDRAESRRTATATELRQHCDDLNAEAEADGSGLTYAIAQITTDAQGEQVTFDFG